MRLQNKVALITGGTSGIGEATALLFAREGAKVAITGRNEESGHAVAKKIAESGGQAIFIRTDVSKAEDCKHAVNETLRTFDRLDILFNNAGVFFAQTALECSEKEWDLQIDINLKGTFLMSKYALEPMIAQGAGVIVNNSSGWGLVGGDKAVAYCASKGGVVLLTKALAVELAPRGVRVNALCPSDVETPMLAFQADRYGRGDPEGYRRALLEKYPQGSRARFIQPEEVAAAVAWMCSPEAGPLSGAAISLDFAITAGY